MGCCKRFVTCRAVYTFSASFSGSMTEDVSVIDKEQKMFRV